jgi:import inner membrane translocase subunit TIM54
MSLGLPKNFGKKLPSRNWMIFFSIVGTWTGAVVYDRQQKKRIQKKWTEEVSHLALEPLSPMRMPRRLTIFLSAPPADGLLTAREHYHEYVAPILVASGLDWDAVEGRKEGDVRAGLAERIRKLRKRRGETTSEPLAEDDLEVLIDDMREKMGVGSVGGVRGDIVIGRNTWKEYIRGLHEGWLGPLDPPKPAEEEAKDSLTRKEDTTEPNGEIPHVERPHDFASIPNFAAEQVMQRLPHANTPASEFASTITAQTPADDPSPSADTTPEQEVETDGKAEDKAEDKPNEDSTKPKKPSQPAPFISTSEYPSSTLSTSIPPEFAPSIAIPVPHILGFMNTPIRIYRYLTKRYVADEIGRQVAAACFAAYAPYERRGGSGKRTIRLHLVFSTHATNTFLRPFLFQSQFQPR